jgi:phosphatidylserine/phosphatidylglycerophosphate/cardiolipin synthase-like enzyme
VSAVHILATGLEFIRAGTRGVEPVIEEIIHDAREEIQLMTYSFTPRAQRIMALLEKAAERSIKVTIIVNRLDLQEDKIKHKLRFLKQEYADNVHLVDFSDANGRELHAKVVVVDRKKTVIGSANLSGRGMVHNYEIGVLIEGQKAWEMARLIDSFVQRLFKQRPLK